MSIDLYTWDTPNGQKPVLLLEEIGAQYEIVPVNILEGAQDDETFRAVNPNGKIPAMRDADLVIFESGAILLHFSEKSGRFMPQDPAARMTALSWIFWQVGGLGPMAGQWGHFARREERDAYAEKRYLDETLRLLAVLEKGLENDGWLAGGAYTIADMMAWPWANPLLGMFGASGAIGEGEFPAVRRWAEAIANREATVRGMAKLKAAIAG